MDSVEFIFIPFVNPDGYAVSHDQSQNITCLAVCSTHGLMIVCGVKIGDQDHLVMVWILTGTMMNIGVRYSVYQSFLYSYEIV